MLAQHKEGHEYGVLVSDIGVCHKQLQQWSEAVTFFKEAVEHTTRLRCRLSVRRPKQYEEAEEALAIIDQREHERTAMVAE